MTRTAVRGARKWTYEGDNTFTRQFGPIKATISRKWGMTSDPTEYYAFLSVGEERFSVPISELGVPWHDDKIEVLAIRRLEKLIKSHIRSWTK